MAVYDVAALIDASLIKPVDQGYLFAHALTREKLFYTPCYAWISPAMHQAAADWFKDRDVLLYATHLEEARSIGTSCDDAARAAEARFNRTDALSLAARGLAANPELDIRFDLLILKGNMLRETGKLDAAIEVFEVALKSAKDTLAICRAQIGMVATMRIQDRIDDAFDLLEKAEALATKEKLIPQLSEIILKEVYTFRGQRMIACPIT